MEVVIHLCLGRRKSSRKRLLEIIGGGMGMGGCRLAILSVIEAMHLVVGIDLY